METLLEYLTLDHALDFIKFALGLLYLYWEYHADRKMWIANIIMPAISFWLYYNAGLYADFLMNIYYFVIPIYGWIVWSRSSEKKAVSAQKSKVAEALRVRHIPLRTLLGCFIVFALVYALMVIWLLYGTDSTVPYLDAFTSALSIVAMWMLARKYVEQWLAWILVDAVSCGLYIYKGIPFSGILYAVYTVIAVFGYRKWLRLMQRP